MQSGVPVAIRKKEAAVGNRSEKIWMADDFDAHLPDDRLAASYGGVPKPNQPGRMKEMSSYSTPSVWLWSLESPDRLSSVSRGTVENGQGEIYLSAATTWQLGSKMGPEKLTFPRPARAAMVMRGSI